MNIFIPNKICIKISVGNGLKPFLTKNYTKL